ncbi:MAG: rod shape-determining protein MreC [Candidatus Limnocylindria bacterium]
MRRVPGLPTLSGVSGASPHRRSRSGAWWAALVVVSLALVAVSGTEPARSVQQASARLLSPVQGVLTGLGAGVADVVETITEIDRLRTENDELRSALVGAEQRIAELQEAARENASLRALLDLPPILGWELLPARVTTAGTSVLSWEVGINVGRMDGVRVGMPVVGAAEGGGALAGVVVEASQEGAVVRLLVDPRARVVTRDQETEALGLVQGQPGGQLIMTQVTLTDEIAVGDTIVTAGLELEGVAASPFPRGLLVGTVTALEADSNGLTQTAFIRPALDPRTVERLMVVLSTTID